MKIHLILEPHDVKDMLEQYFSAQGFEVKNLVELCEAFKATYPEGIDVEATPVAVPATPARAKDSFIERDGSDDGGVGDSMPAPAAPSTVLAPKQKGNPRLGLSDLMDPNNFGNVPTKNELFEETSRELQEILNASKALETTRR